MVTHNTVCVDHIIPNTHQLISSSGCWITQAYPGQRIALEYFWMWMAAFMNILLYIPITLVLKGFMTVSGWRVKFLSRSERRHVSQAAIDRDDIDHIAVKMLL